MVKGMPVRAVGGQRMLNGDHLKMMVKSSSATVAAAPAVRAEGETF